MAITNGYATLAEFKAVLWPSGVSSTGDTSEDTQIERFIEAASRQIDDDTGRRFYTTSADEIRYYRPISRSLVLPDDIVSIATSGLQTDEDMDGTYETTWATTDYQLLPDNGAVDGQPYNQLLRAPLGSYVFPVGYKSVKITGKFGHTTAPIKIKSACLLYAQYLYGAKNSFGGQGRNSWTVEEQLNQYKALISAFVRIV